MSLTHQERKILIFVSALFALGLALSLLRKSTGCNVCLIKLFSEKNAATTIDLNQATREDLMTLPGIGEKRADAILALRVSRGGLRSLEDLKNIKGLNDALLERIRPHIKEIEP